jgi:hypothetical protein
VPNYRLVLTDAGLARPARSIDFEAHDPSYAFILAQAHDGPAELWRDDKHVCTLRHTGTNGDIWIISGNENGDAQLN